jgi:hypothetical protein
VASAKYLSGERKPTQSKHQMTPVHPPKNLPGVMDHSSMLAMT